MPPLGPEHLAPRVPEKSPEEKRKERLIATRHQEIASQVNRILPSTSRKLWQRDTKSAVAVYQTEDQLEKGAAEQTRAWLVRHEDNGSTVFSLHTDRVVFDPKDPTNFGVEADDGRSRQFDINRNGVLQLKPFNLDERVDLLDQIADTLQMIETETFQQSIRNAR